MQLAPLAPLGNHTLVPPVEVAITYVPSTSRSRAPRPKGRSRRWRR